jgi:hypothetical protein
MRFTGLPTASAGSDRLPTMASFGVAIYQSSSRATGLPIVAGAKIIILIHKWFS